MQRLAALRAHAMIQYRNRQTHYLAVHITSVFEKGENIMMGKKLNLSIQLPDKILDARLAVVYFYPKK